MLIEGSWNAGPSDQIGLEIDTNDSTVAGLDWDIHAHANGAPRRWSFAFQQTTVSYDFRPTVQDAVVSAAAQQLDASILTLDIEMNLYGQALWTGFQ